jgi:hypothetical protein
MDPLFWPSATLVGPASSAGAREDQIGTSVTHPVAVFLGHRRTRCSERVVLVVARLAHMQRCTTFVKPGVPTLLVLRWSVGAVFGGRKFC